VLLEGTARDLDGCDMRWEAIQGAMITMTLFMGLAVLRSRRPEDTVRTLLYAARQRRAFTGMPLARRERRPRSKAALQAHILQSLPGVGPERATRLLRRFGSVEAALTANTAALADVPGIGPGVARRIRWTVEEAPARYAIP
jgi:DNA excision repair protein ERCC-4